MLLPKAKAGYLTRPTVKIRCAHCLWWPGGKRSGVGEVKNWTSSSTYDIFTDLSAAFITYWTFLVAQMQETWVQKTPEKQMATYSSVLTWRILWTEEPGGLQPMESQKVGHK